MTTSGKTVHLTLIAGYKGLKGDLNFNGYANGKMTIVVPLGAHVKVTFRNPSLLAASAQIVNYTPTPPTHRVPDAFKGANSRYLQTGIPRGGGQRFSFTASKAGRYLLISAVPGHDAAGMWDYFVVSKSARTASVRHQ